MNPPPCDDNANCDNNEGSYECECKTGFTGDGFHCTGIHNIKVYLMCLL